MSFKNCGNTCYFASTLQCLLSTKLFNDYFVKTNKETQNNSNIVNQLIKIIVKFNHDEVIDPIEFYNAFYDKCNKYNNQQQHDSHELFIDFLDILRKEVSLLNESLYTFKNNKKAIQSYQDGLHGFTVIDELFKIQYMNVVECKSCQFKIQTIVSEFGLYINNHENIINSIQNVFNCENLEDYKCDKCDNINTCTSYSKLMHIPPYLCILIKRHPMHSLKDLPETININQKLYELYAYSSHHGMTTKNGHYVAHVKQHDNQWFLKNDTLNIHVHQKPVSFAYMVFYKSNSSI